MSAGAQQEEGSEDALIKHPLQIKHSRQRHQRQKEDGRDYHPRQDRDDDRLRLSRPLLPRRGRDKCPI